MSFWVVLVSCNGATMKKPVVLIVDDDPIILAYMSKILSPQYTVRAANSGKRAISIAETDPTPDLILLDVQMAGVDGYSVLEQLKQIPSTQETPVIFVTVMEATHDEQRGFALGAVDYITKPIRPAILLARVRNHLILKEASDYLRDKNSFLEAEVSRRMAENQLIQSVSIRALAHLAETRDPETGEHILRTQAYVKTLALKLRKSPRFSPVLSTHYIELLTKSAPLHDIGKVGIPDQILLKPGKLNAHEWEIMKTHAAMGAQAIEQAEKDVDHSVEFLLLAKEIANWHHEHWNGSGYPDGLHGDNIPVSARLMALADVFDALVFPRVYKPAMPFSQARDIIVADRGKQFDPEVVDAFLDTFEQFMAIAQRYGGDAVCSVEAH